MSDVALRINHGCNAFGTNQVGGVRQAAEIELFEDHPITVFYRPRFLHSAWRVLAYREV